MDAKQLCKKWALHACMYAYMHVCVHTCINVFMYECMYVFIFVCTKSTRTQTRALDNTWRNHSQHVGQTKNHMRSHARVCVRVHPAFVVRATSVEDSHINTHVHTHTPDTNKVVNMYMTFAFTCVHTCRCTYERLFSHARIVTSKHTWIITYRVRTT